MSHIRKRPAKLGLAALVAATALLLVGFSGSAGAAKVIKKFTTETASTPGISQGDNAGGYAVLSITATCPSDQVPVAANAYFTRANVNEAGAVTDGEELLLAGIKKNGNGYTAEGVSDVDNAAKPHDFVIEVTCATKKKV